MTIDRGPENSDHEAFTRQTEMPVYACNPYHSWEKGSVENSIGRFRFFIPKGTSVDNLTQKQLDTIEGVMNNTPRKVLGYLTPNEAYERILIDSNTQGCCTSTANVGGDKNYMKGVIVFDRALHALNSIGWDTNTAMTIAMQIREKERLDRG